MTDKYSPDVSVAFKHIGHMANNWALLEGTIEEILWFLLNTKKGRAVTAHIGTPKQIEIIRQLTKEVVSDEAIKEDLNPILAQINDLRIRRNQAIHCKWDSAEGDDIHPVLKGLDYYSRASHEPIEIRLGSQEIADTTNQIELAHSDLLNFYLPLGFTPAYVFVYAPD